MKYVCVLMFAGTGLVAQQSITINENPSREFGQLKLFPTSNLGTSAPNLVEGRELSGPESIAFDTTASPPILYVADRDNNRVLAWTNPAARQPGDLADKVIGQRDMFSTFPLGPGTSLSAGLRTPMAVAVDKNGSLYVLDAGNNRILRFPKPFQQTGDLLSTDLVIGQRTVSSGLSANQGLAQPNEKTLGFQQGGTVYTAALAFDSAGNLWVTDPLNNRVLRFPVSSLAPNVLDPAADLVLGQSSFTTSTVPADPEGILPQRNKNVIDQPSGMALDQAGRLYVTDRRSRALYFPVLSTGVPAARILGVPPVPQQGQPRISFPNEYNVAAFTPQGQAIGFAEGIFTSANSVFICDTGDHRIMRFGTPESWLAETDILFSPKAVAVLGQADFVTGKADNNQKEPNAGGFKGPEVGAFLGTDLWIADTGNNRVISLPQTGSLVFGAATKVLGQFGLNYGAPNLIEGRELWINGANFTGGAVVVDRNSNPPHLYIADTGNNRVLGFRDARLVGTDTRKDLQQRADLVIGQPDLFRSVANYPSGDPLAPSDSGLLFPVGLAVDAAGNLWVADQGNGRVLRFPSPFAQTAGALQHATVILGQVGFTAPPVKDAGIANLSAPHGVALLSNGNLVVSDVDHNRVVIFRRPPGGDFSNYQGGLLVLGQPDFSSRGFGNGPGQMKFPHHIAVDSSDRLYVADGGNSRLMVFTNLATSSNGATSVFQLGNLNAIYGVAVSSITGEIWVTNTTVNQVFRFPEFQQLQLNPTQQPNTTLGSGLPVALALDSFDNVIVVEGFNRAVFFYAKAVTQHAASYNARPLAPGQLAYIYRLGKPFSFTPADGAAQSPWPINLGDIQVTVSGINAPIFRVNASRIDFQVPMSTPSSGTVDFEVRRVSTGEIIAAVTAPMAPSNPGFFTSNASGFGLAAATNEDNTVNTPQNAAKSGQVITFYLTGQGFVDGAPPDGVAPSTAAPTAVKPVVFSSGVTGGIVDPAAVQYSGLGAFAGGWQINFKIPESIPPGNNNVIAVSLNDTPSSVGPTGTIIVTYATK